MGIYLQLAVSHLWYVVERCCCTKRSSRLHVRTCLYVRTAVWYSSAVRYEYLSVVFLFLVPPCTFRFFRERQGDSSMNDTRYHGHAYTLVSPCFTTCPQRQPNSRHTRVGQLLVPSTTTRYTRTADVRTYTTAAVAPKPEHVHLGERIRKSTGSHKASAQNSGGCRQQSIIDGSGMRRATAWQRGRSTHR